METWLLEQGSSREKGLRNYAPRPEHLPQFSLKKSALGLEFQAQFST